MRKNLARRAFLKSAGVALAPPAGVPLSVFGAAAELVLFLVETEGGSL